MGSKSIFLEIFLVIVVIIIARGIWMDGFRIIPHLGITETVIVVGILFVCVLGTRRRF